ncbi:uncharacterized protein PHALS_15442 [Plasmopara halstedii]|uniref:Uncharacterized protein n=1 Tax=Plasmopara halstedii TaxID=4781 RepID=A0A0P1AHJ0_PLAHL|nr:uncharacterized protein PHALS_15442 [Plasmopara halstedii]CEG40402.1 hypothetical protein PHALS_15442 [Plasmopara halstedii]|eukprot:XP_024576771.1 hypothetical protein PHALS_15442 [Plasmopara halstedii]
MQAGYISIIRSFEFTVYMRLSRRSSQRPATFLECGDKITNINDVLWCYYELRAVHFQSLRDHSPHSSQPT